MKIQGTKIRGLKLYSSAATVDADSYFDLVTLLLPGNGTNGAQNNTFQDSSVNAYTITRNGNTTQGTFSPFSQTGWSGYFDGTGDYLTAPSNSAFAFGTGDFSIEAWVYPQGTQNYNTIAATNSSGSYQTGRWWFEYSQTRGFAFVTGSVSYVQACTVNLNVWTHIAVTRSGTSLRFFLNGVQQGSTQTASDDLNTTTTCAVGALANGVQPFTGYISNARIVKGSAVYTANFTVPTTPLTAISGTSLLTCQSNRFIDNSTNAFAITVNGNTAVQAFAPFDPATAYAAGTVGGSGYFDGSGDRLLWPGTTLAGDFTVECWVYKTAVDASGYTNVFSASGIGLNNQFAIDQTTPGSISLDIGGGSGQEIPPAGTAVTLNAWHHLAWVREGSTLRAYVDGVQQGSGTSSSSFSIGCLGSYNPDDGGAYEMNGYISSARVTNACLYPSGTTFTPSTVPFTTSVSSGTVQLLINFTNGGITDATAKNVLETVGGAAISTTQSKWGGSSMYFDGSGDYLYIPSSLNFTLASDFTIEGWAYREAFGNYRFFTVGDAVNTTGIEIYVSSGNWVVYSNGSTRIVGSTATRQSWTHLAVVRSGSTVTLYVNGTASGSTWSSSDTFSGRCYVGAEYYNTTVTADTNGWINDFRITRGYARYTANFTAPTAAFPTQ